MTGEIIPASFCRGFAGAFSQRDADVLALFALAICSQREEQFFELSILRHAEDNRESYGLAWFKRFGLNGSAFKVVTDRHM